MFLKEDLYHGILYFQIRTNNRWLSHTHLSIKILFLLDLSTIFFNKDCKSGDNKSHFLMANIVCEVNLMSVIPSKPNS